MPVMDTFERVVEGTNESFQRENAGGHRKNLRSHFKPWASALIGLAVVFTLWGFIHRFDQYHFRNDVVSRTGAIKISSEERKSFQASLEATLAKADANSEIFILAATAVEVPMPTRTDLDEPTVEAQELAPGASRAPGRAPPSLVFSSLA